VAHHRRGLRRLLRDDALLERLDAETWEPGAEERLDDALGPRRRALVGYVAKLTRAPAGVREEDVTRLRAQGFTDADVLAVCEVAAYYAFANRVVDGLGVELEPWNTEAESGAANTDEG